MKITSPIIVEEAYDTGIYRDEPKWSFPLNTVKDIDAFRQRTEADADELFNLDSLLTQAEDFARKIRERYEDRGGVPRLPSKEDRIPANVKRQVHYAKYLLSQITMTRQAVEKGDVQKVAIHAYWVGRYHEALRICQVEHIAARERRAMAGRRAGHAAKHGTTEEKAARWDAYQEALDTLAAKNPHWSLTALRQDVATQFRKSFKTLERHTQDPRKTH